MHCEKKSGSYKNLSSKLAIALMLTIVPLGMSCRSTKITKESNLSKINEQTSYVGIKEIDSIFVYRHDSIIVQKRHDTVFIEQYKTDYKFKLQADTLIQTDTIYLEKTILKTETIQKNKPLSRWNKLLMLFGTVCVCMFIHTIFKKLKKN